MKTCIATGRYYLQGETFVNRHIRKIFGGASCVVAGEPADESPMDVPVFYRPPPPRGLAALYTSPLKRIATRIEHKTSRVPFGAARQDMIDFWTRNQVDLVLAEFGTQALAVAPVAKAAGLPMFTYFRGVDASRSLQKPRICEAYRRMMTNLHGVFAVSQFLVDNLAAKGIVHANTHVIPSGVDVRLFQPGPKSPKSCLAVGRLVEKKSPLITLRAFARAALHHPDARLTMVGDGPLLEQCRALAKELNISEQVSLPGSLPHQEVGKLLATSQIFLQHSVTARDGNTEGLPTAIQEALACGAAVISTRHAGIPEAVDEGRTGFLVDEFDEDAYAKALRALFDTPPSDAMATAARQTACERFDNDVLLHNLETAITRTLSDRAMSMGGHAPKGAA